MGQVISTGCPTVGEQQSLIGDHTIIVGPGRIDIKLDGPHTDGSATN